MREEVAREERGIPADLLAQVRRLEIRTRRVVEDLFGGEYHSVFKGQGVEFREVREYEPGDDVRSIDWNVTARTGKPHVKKYEEERELTVMLLVDLSASQRFGSQHRQKSAAMAELGALLAFSAISNQDKVGLVLFTDEVELYLPPKKGKRHALRCVRELLYHPPRSAATDLRPPLELLSRVQKRKSVAFLLSDFLADGYDRVLRSVARRHDLIAVRFFDPRERSLADVGLVQLVDAETGARRVVDMGSRRVRRWFEENASRRDEALARTLRKAGCDRMDVDIAGSVVDPLARFFRKRERR
jgi:uncharacterized protein (DUF58 family)